MAKFSKGKSGNPKGRPLAAKGLREALEAKYGKDGAALVERLEELSQLRGRYTKIALDATALLLAYLAGKPAQAITGADGGDLAIALTKRVVFELHPGGSPDRPA